MGFCEIADLAKFLQIDIPLAKEPSAQRAIDEATAAIKLYCRQELEQVADEALTLDCAGGTRLLLPELPITDVASVVEDDETLTVDDDYKLGQYGILHRIAARWAVGIQIITVTYSHGYAVIPENIVNVCVRAASRAYQAGLRAEEAEGVPGIQAKGLGDFSVQFGAEVGSSGESTLGASASPILLRSEKRVLDEYRI